VTQPPLAVVVMAAGLGTRMRSAVPKHLHPILGRRIVDWVLDAVAGLGAARVVLVTSPETSDAVDGPEVAVQAKPLGTGDAVASARPVLEGFDGDVLVLDGAAPLLTTELLRGLLDEHRSADAAATILSIEPDHRLPYGRILRDADGSVRGIVEEKDATPEERAVRELNSSIYVFAARDLWPALERLQPKNAQGELYLTDTIGLLVGDGKRAAAWRCPDARSPEGINTRAELASAAAMLRDRVNEAHMLAGATIVDPAATWIDHGVELERDVVVHPFTVLRGSTVVGEGAEIGPHVVAIDTQVGSRAVVGPFCYLRPGTVLEPGSKAGTFVEIKNSRIGERAKVPHLSYVGDADIGAGSNIGAGTITANFPHEPGRPKGRTTIGRNVRGAVHNAFVAPVEIGDDAWIAAGSIITEDVPPGSLAGFPPRQETKDGWVYRRQDGKRDD
jgi:bifunctional UDP-N-acetylglucosamine pyrophosphorylase / glucosamine-1-phosphate N-acetyltransferase